MGKLIIRNSEDVEDNAEFLWDARNDKEVEAVMIVFKGRIEQGYTAFRCTNGNMEKITSFDKHAEQIYILSMSFGSC